MMKKKQWFLLIPIVICLCVLFLYQLTAKASTDTQPPKITVNTSILDYSVNDPLELLLEGVTAEDDRDGDVTDSILIEYIGGITADHHVTVTYAAFDRSGNVSKTNRTIHYTDYHAPRFTLERSLVFPNGSDFEIMDYLGAEDILDGNIRHRIKATPLSDIFTSTEGSYEALIQVTNSLGDTAEMVIPIEILSAGKHNSSLNLTDYLIYLPAGSEFNAKDHLDSFIYSLETVDLSGGIPEDYNLRITGEVDTDTPGIYEVSYAVSHMLGEQLFSAYSKLIVVVEG